MFISKKALLFNSQQFNVIAHEMIFIMKLFDMVVR